MRIENENKSLSQQDKKIFEEGLVETKWTTTGEPYYIIKDGADPAVFAQLAKAILEDEKIIAHDFTSKVVNESGKQEAEFTYKSGWFLEGIAEREME